MGRQFKFPLNVEIGAVPNLEGNNKSMMFQYLLDVDKYLALSTSVLQVLVKERQETQQYW